MFSRNAAVVVLRDSLRATGTNMAAALDSASACRFISMEAHPFVHLPVSQAAGEERHDH